MTAPDPTPLRDQLAEALRTAPVRGTAMRMTVLTELYGPVNALADAVLAVVQPELDQWEQRYDAEAMASAGIFHTYYRRWQGTIAEARRQGARADKATARGDIWKAKAIAIEQDRDRLIAELDRYRSAWQSARRRAEAYSDDVWQVTAERDDAREQLVHALAVAAGKIAREPAVIHVEGPAVEATLTTIAVRTADERADKAEAERDRAMAGVPLICTDDRHHAKVDALETERDQLRAQLAAVRAVADDLYTAPRKVNACGVREQLLGILTPAGPTLTIAEAMAGQPDTNPKET